MESDDGKNKIYIALAIILGILILISIFLLFRKNTIEAPDMEKEEQVSIMDIPGIGEPSNSWDKKEAEVDISITPQYHGSFSWDKIGEWLKDPSELLDKTSVSIDGSIRF